MSKMYRRGAIGALLDEYERAILELKKMIEEVPDHALTIITDPQTADENCKSVQAILSHVVHSGFGYATKILNLKEPATERPGKTFHVTVNDYIEDLTSVFSFTENVFYGIKDDELEQLNDSLKIRTGWGQLYDIEQLMEHAIVHILRHRRQIEKIKLDGLK